MDLIFKSLLVTILMVLLSVPSYHWHKHFKKQPFADVLQNRYSQKFRNIHRKTPVLESLFNKVARLKAWNFIKKRLSHRCLPVNIAKFLIAAVFIERHWRLLLYFRKWSKVALFRLYFSLNNFKVMIDGIRWKCWNLQSCMQENFSFEPRRPFS